MERLASWGWRRFGVRYFWAYTALEVASAYVIAIATLGLLTLYERVTGAEFVRIAIAGCVCVLLSLAVGARKVLPKAKPLLRWAAGGRRPEHAPEAWRAAIALPVEFVTRALRFRLRSSPATASFARLCPAGCARFCLTSTA